MFTLHMHLYDLALLAVVFVGMPFSLMLFCVKRGNKRANRYLGVILLIIILDMIRVLGAQIYPTTFPQNTGLTVPGFSLALGPLIYFYVSAITKPNCKLRYISLFHFIPFLAEAILAFYYKMSLRDGITAFCLPIFISVGIYLFAARNRIKDYFRELKFNGADRFRHRLRWLNNLLSCFALSWLLSVPVLIVVWLYNNAGMIPVLSIIYFLYAVPAIVAAGMVILEPEISLPAEDPYFLRLQPDESQRRGSWLKKVVKEAGYYRDPDLSLTSLAAKLELTTHELSRLINTVLKTNFNDFINAYRVADIVSKMKDKAYEHITLEGIAYDSGFNSPRTFHRAFKQLTGETPAAYKKQLPSYNMAYGSRRPVIISDQVNRNHMFKNYLKIAWRNSVRHKASSFINISGLAVGMAVAMLIGLWIWDEVSFNKFNTGYDRIVQVIANKHTGGGLVSQSSLPLPLSAELRRTYGSNFKQIAAALTFEQNINYNNHAFSRTGCYTEPAFTDIITLKMIRGSKTAFNTRGTVLIDESLARTLFGDKDPVNKIIKINDIYLVQVGGVYQDLPPNTQFSNVDFIAPINILFQNPGDMNNWYDSSFQIFASLNSGSDIQQLSHKIQSVLYEHAKDAARPELLLFPMRQWHLYEFKDGAVVPGRLQYVWLFGVIGVFVLLLACINFMNLSTARSEKRAKEVGIRKAIGSLRGQLIAQFLSESFLIVAVAFLIAVVLAWLALPLFNNVSGKQLSLIWDEPLVWLICFCFCLLTGLIAGSYPAIYLSSFNAVKVLKGTFRVGPAASVPRKILVVIQFAVSVAMIVGTIVVFKQIQFAKNRSVGYNRDNLVSIPYNAIKGYGAFREELLRTGAVSGVSASSNPMTGIWSGADNLSWRGKDPNRQEEFGTVLIEPDFGTVVGWKMKEGRSFSSEFLSDSSGFLFNEAAIRQMGLKNPVGETIKWHGKDWKVLGVVKDMVMTSPFDPITPVVFLMDDRQRSFNVVNLKLNSGLLAAQALARVEAVFRKFAPEAPFNYKFTNDEYARKFMAEERTGRLASVFAVLAIFISCLGLFGVASFVAEQRVKEIGIRKVLGASVFGIWGLLSKEFVVLVGIALLFAIPLSWYTMHQWLQHYTYRTELSWWIFAFTSTGAVALTMLTVSYHSFKAALANPVKSLRSE
ncbi:ABC-type antimicrobial peptide transport system, permease component [Mucilaginibacter gossypiicola]|uniref:ABC-type antimicrobial peptide transport system, permease component n=1 Tax=Mucilaginibacter gossypiicola TaxID=551995 RepID=A0A1H8BJN4_9SPHI|nr:ABC transporter permease [Mucilaginibacter gossypiicola]SEM82993.1 ABC-type antimicrobial peptide transport system, permease component [Mucilaginibacter gossypiicola]